MALVSCNKAAQQMGLAPSTITRWLKQSPKLNHGRKKNKILVDVDELITHRAGRATTQQPMVDKGIKDQYDKARTQREIIRLQRDAMDLKLKKGELIERHEAEDVIAEVARLFQTLMKRMNRVLARRFRAEPREFDKAYKTVMDQMKQEFSNRYNA